MTESTWDVLNTSYNRQSDILADALNEADAVVIGIGAGMSASDGFTYIGERFTQNFPDFIKKYGFFDMLQASLHTFESWQEYWAFQSRFVALNYLDQPVGASYTALNQILSNKDYHIITTNADNAFAVADFDLDKVFHIQGEYILWQCSQHCHAQTYRDDAAIRQMIVEQENMEVPRELLPHCPECDAPMEINKRKAQVGMVEDTDFHAQLSRYNQFLDAHKEDKVLYLEIGIGYTTPQYVKQPFQRMTRHNPNALFMTMNKKAYRIPENIRDRTIHLTEDISTLITEANKKLTI
ncbi:MULTISPECIES: SIR2 family NAD-dependent protein deacylase [Staphylococcus]|uniref:SIR2 family NAD-dependent protein deacylase n=1 Tax=Staphylococcus TaxID=1279 RepID=UPI000853CE85|nr:NAD-dependent deacetylase [Staphylococcus equorum]MCM3072868.1 NAD-dependent deacetylase [Staphylococcus equorum]MDK9846798.1 NAD-dependent deacetylase [Staphylococcus equorum]MDK9847848.1 NAD-dependent deacetylase [Staphylococcus equorum]MDK9854864.1 NAD-dependent deacetylase [Staphylococcus equorum]MEB7674829.1 NAD-dependent deacetylase [Staphylococcus equorum]